MPCVPPRFSIEFYAADNAAKISGLSTLRVKYDAMVVGRNSIAEVYQTVSSRLHQLMNATPQQELDALLVTVVTHKTETSAKVVFLLGCGASPDARSFGAKKPVLTWACTLNNTAVVEILLTAKANVEQPFNRGGTALAVAARGCRNKIAKQLLDAGADMNASDQKGVTVLQAAVMVGNLSLTRSLITKGAVVNILRKKFFHHCLPYYTRNFCDYRCTHKHCDVRMLATLVELGVDICRSGKSPFVQLCTPGRVELHALIQNRYMAFMMAILMGAFHKRSKSFLRVLGVDLLCHILVMVGHTRTLHDKQMPWLPIKPTKDVVKFLVSEV